MNGPYGRPPVDLGEIPYVDTSEMMCWLYCPIRTPTDGWQIPKNLRDFMGPISGALHDHAKTLRRDLAYVYLTAKTLHVAGEATAQRPGWHTDGFGTDDVNYVWCDREPTEFIDGAFDLPADCEDAMERMTAVAEDGRPIYSFPPRHLLRLDPFVVHRARNTMAPGMRTFVKVSFSKDRYNLLGNSINHDMTEIWPLLPREEVRNHPVRADYLTKAAP